MSSQKEAWTPIYRLPGGPAYTVEGIESSECPVSAITPESKVIVDLDSKARRIKDASGAAFPSANPSEWPAWWADAVAHIELMNVLESNARQVAQHEEWKRKNPQNGR